MSPGILAVLLLSALPASAQTALGRAKAGDVPSVGEGREVSASGAKAVAGDPAEAAKALAIAEEAVKEREVPAWTRKLLESQVIPALKQGCLFIVKVDEKDIPGSAAVYDSDLDAIKTPAIDLRSPDSRAKTLHELVHAGQDGARKNQMREDSEAEAYEVQVEYLMRGRGVLAEAEGGLVGIKSADVAAMGAVDRVLVYRYAAANVKAGRADLNDFSDASGMRFKGDKSSDVRQYFEDMAETTAGSAKNEWAMATNIGAMVGSGVRNTKEFLEKDGLTRCR
ncbi:hypothetical protein EPO15_05370 [bacterium]|nr:MAG: hypothetical protein EPO15_05370 [bacterium]